MIRRIVAAVRAFRNPDLVDHGAQVESIMRCIGPHGGAAVMYEHQSYFGAPEFIVVPQGDAQHLISLAWHASNADMA